MTTPDAYTDFRLNLEQQKKRAKELLRAAKAGEAAALQRMAKHVPAGAIATPALAQAQHTLARELRFVDWSALKRHIEAMNRQREQLLGERYLLDDDMKTIHIRCGHDIQRTLQQAGFRGDFNVQIDPFVQGPVTATQDWLQLRARFICDAFGPDFVEENVLAGCHEEERRLLQAINDYQRVVLWFELDAHDQLILLRCLAFFAEHGIPPRLELVDACDFPGARRFLGLGQLPPEALRLLWSQRRVLHHEHLQLAQEAWQAYRNEDPRGLWRLLQTRTPLLPTLVPALMRQLQELPSPRHGLGLTQYLLLSTLARFGKLKVMRLIGETLLVRDAYSGIGDSGLHYELKQLARAGQAIFTIEDLGGMRNDTIEINALGRALLAGEVNWLSLDPPARWVGGVCIKPGQRNWHWDETSDKPVLL